MKKARVTEEHKTNYILSADGEELLATVRGSFFTENAFPKVGDFVEYSDVGDGRAVIEEVSPRRSVIARKAVPMPQPFVPMVMPPPSIPSGAPG